MKTVVYACANLAYDQIFSPVVATPGLEYVLFSDRKPFMVSGWDWCPAPAAVEGLSPSMANRYCKFFPQRIFPEADVSIYVDANILVIGDLRPLLEEFIASGAAIGLFIHKDRSDIQSEFEFCREVGKIGDADHDTGVEQLRFYRAEGLPEAHVFTENAIILRRHSAPGLDPAMQLWWEQLNRFTKRDQLSLPYVLWKTGLATQVWNWSYWNDNPYFTRYIHRRGWPHDIYIYLTNKRHYSAAWRIPVDGMLYVLHGLVKPALAKLRG